MASAAATAFVVAFAGGLGGAAAAAVVAFVWRPGRSLEAVERFARSGRRLLELLEESGDDRPITPRSAFRSSDCRGRD